MRSVPSLGAGGQARPVQLGKYALLGAIGRGGMGDVYLALAQGPSGIRKLVVVKSMRAGMELDDALAQMFLDEGRLAALLNHPNVVHTYEVVQSDEGLYIVMEYLHGQPLSAIWRVAKPLDPRVSGRIVADALTGLHYAHELQDLDGTPLHIVHRDLSPPNIFVTHDGVVKLVDFGIAKTAIATRASTEAGLVKGKLSYMAPEQATGRTVDRRADIYAIGVVLWELLTGRRLVEDPSSVLRQALHGKTAPLVSSVQPEIDPALDRIVERALWSDPDARYPTALEMRDALEDYLAQGSATGAKELRRLMAQHFSSQREQRETQIHNWVTEFSPAHTDAIEIPTTREPSGDQISGAIEVKPPTEPKPLRSRMPFIASGATVAVLGGLAAFALSPRSPKSEAKPRPIEVAVAPAVASSVPPEIVSAAPATPPVTSAPAPAPSHTARLTTRSHSTRQAPQITSTLARPTQPKPKGNPTLESNPYLHSQ